MQSDKKKICEEYFFFQERKSLFSMELKFFFLRHLKLESEYAEFGLGSQGKKNSFCSIFFTLENLIRFVSFHFENEFPLLFLGWARFIVDIALLYGLRQTHTHTHTHLMNSVFNMNEYCGCDLFPVNTSTRNDRKNTLKICATPYNADSTMP